jgi:hypothetical protein
MGTQPGYFTSLRRSFAPIAGFPLLSNKAFRGEAVVFYLKLMITQQMGDSDLPKG